MYGCGRDGCPIGFPGSTPRYGPGGYPGNFRPSCNCAGGRGQFTGGYSGGYGGYDGVDRDRTTFMRPGAPPYPESFGGAYPGGTMTPGSFGGAYPGGTSTPGSFGGAYPGGTSTPGSFGGAYPGGTSTPGSFGGAYPGGTSTPGSFGGAYPGGISTPGSFDRGYSDVRGREGYGWTNPTASYPSIPGQMSQGYHWVKSSVEPNNAVFGGTDKDGGPIYVGRANHEGELLPAKITSRHGCAYVCFNGEEHKKCDYEYFCTSTGVSWVPDGDGKVPMHAVSSGRTKCGETLYIGRVRHDGTLSVGKIHPSHRVLFLPYDGKEISFSSYEVLVVRPY